jgi:hypothetical protein
MFAGDFFVQLGGGSNLAVRNGYVAVGGGFGDINNFPEIQPNALVAQVDSAGTIFAVGNYEFTPSGFSGTLDADASDITVVDAAKTDSDYINEFTITDFDPDWDNLNVDLIGTLYYGNVGGDDRLVNGAYSVSIDDTGAVTMETGRGTVLFGNVPDNPITGSSHFHIMKDSPDIVDLFFGDDDNYVKLPAGQGVEISANGSTWQFGTDGTTTFPENTIKNVANTSIKIGNPLVSGVVVATVDELIPPGDVWRLFIDSDIYPALGTTVHIGGTVTTAWGTPITATITDIQQDNNTDRWIILVAQDITAGFDAGPKTVSFAESYKTWTFGTDGTLTLPKNSSVGEVTPATGAAANVIVIQSASSILNTSFASLPPAPINNYNVPGTNIVVNVTWSTNGEDYHAPAFTVVDGGSGHTGGGESGGGDVLTVPYADMGISGGGNWTWYVADIAGDVVLTAGLESWTLKGDGRLTFPDDTVQTTAYPGITTVAKNGPVAEDVGKGEAATVTVSPSNNINLNVGTVLGVVFGTGFTLDITVAANGDISAVVTDSVSNLSVGDYGTVLGGGSLGGTVGVDDTTFTVATLTNVIAATAIDLTKTINKLADGVYTLADGVEGQIMYLVRQNGSTAANISVLVANARWDGSVYSDQYINPFQIPFTDMVTIIFTDGAWQSSTFGSLT